MFLKAQSSKLKAQKGFTLIEVLIVISIIGLLSSVILVGLGGFRSRGRDARRITDLKSLQNGLELFYSKNGEYPAIIDALLTAGIGINKIPKDPSNNVNYLYSVNSNKQGYVVAAGLDAASGDPIFNDSYDGGTSDYSGTVTSCAPPAYCIQF